MATDVWTAVVCVVVAAVHLAADVAAVALVARSSVGAALRCCVVCFGVFSLPQVGMRFARNPDTESHRTQAQLLGSSNGNSV